MQEKGPQILSIESFIQISISLLLKEKRVKLSYQGNYPRERIWLAHGVVLAQLLDRMRPSYLSNSQKLLITQRNSQ